MMLPTLPNDARDGESYIRVCLDVSGYGAETKRRSEKPWQGIDNRRAFCRTQ